MSLEVFRATIKYCEDGLCIGGGEPTVHPDFETILLEAIATCYEPGGVFIVTNGKNTLRAMMLARLARSGVIGCELSRDQYHEEIDEAVVSAFECGVPSGCEAHDARGIRTVRPENAIEGGRCDWGDDTRCVCEGPLIDPFGDVHICGCQGARILGNIMDPEYSLGDFPWGDEECGRTGVTTDSTGQTLL